MFPGSGRLKLAPLVAAGLLAAAQGIRAGESPLAFSGSLVGSVVDSMGTPQMGASVALFDRYQRLIRKTLTTANGRFGFPGLSPSLYSIKISAPSLVPATRSDIAVSAGLSSVLEIRLATIFSSVELQYTKPTAAMSDDWKWVLRASTATRAITRALPKAAQGRSSSPEISQKAFTDTRGLVSLSAGDAGSLLSDVGIADFGTSFALATTLYGRNQLTFSGALGQSIRSGMPTMGFRSTFTRTDDDGYSKMPEVTVMAQQLALPDRLSTRFPSDSNLAVRTALMSYYDTMEVLDVVHLEYGASIDSVNYAGSRTRVSPFVRASSDLGRLGIVAATFSNGGNPNDLFVHQFGQDADLAGTVSALSSLPPFSLRNRQLQLQRTTNYEVGYSKTAGGRTYAVSAFRENVTDGRLNVSGDLSGLNQDSILADVATNTSIYNIGSYHRRGIVGSVTQKVNDRFEVSFAAGTMGGFSSDGLDAEDLETGLEQKARVIASTNVNSTLPVVRTRVVANYEYVAGDAIVPRHIFSTQRVYAEPGLNIIMRQPLPSFFGVGKLELSADLRNLLAQGYVPVASSNGRQVLLLQAPRAIRGGLNIIF